MHVFGGVVMLRFQTIFNSLNSFKRCGDSMQMGYKNIRKKAISLNVKVAISFFSSVFLSFNNTRTHTHTSSRESEFYLCLSQHVISYECSSALKSKHFVELMLLWLLWLTVCVLVHINVGFACEPLHFR